MPDKRLERTRKAYDAPLTNPDKQDTVTNSPNKESGEKHGGSKPENKANS
jgi:hypothetical protein